MRIVIFFFFFFFLRFTNFEIIFIFSFWNKNCKRIYCAKAILLQIGLVEITSKRNSRSNMFFKTGDLKNSAILKKCCNIQQSILIKLLKSSKETPTQEFLRTAFVIEHRWLLLTWPYFILWMINELITFSSCDRL